MTAYNWSPNEQTRFNVLISEKTKERVGGSRRFPGSWLLTGKATTRFRYQLRPEYAAACCRKCGRYDTDAIYALGFEFDYRYDVASREDVFLTVDRFPVLSTRALECLRNGKVRGFGTKQIRGTDFHVMQVTQRIPLVTQVFRVDGPRCSSCGVHEDGAGMISLLRSFPPSEIPVERSLFTATERFVAREVTDHDLLCTSDVIDILRAEKIRCGAFHRLLRDEEIEQRTKMLAQGKAWYPPRRVVYLNRY
jgi:hypothetical protein